MVVFRTSKRSPSRKAEQHNNASVQANEDLNHRPTAHLVRSDDVRKAIENVRRAQAYTSEKFALTILEERSENKTLTPVFMDVTEERDTNVLRSPPLAHIMSMTSMQSSNSRTALLGQMPSMTSMQSEMSREGLPLETDLMPRRPLIHLPSMSSLASQSSKTSTKCGNSGIDFPSNNASAIWEPPPPRIGVKFAEINWTARQVALADGSEEEIGPLHHLDVKMEMESGRRKQEGWKNWRSSDSLRQLSCGCWQ